ncbi:hypothetical protein OX284_008170 [Flavobacterium sp. SUN046]|uniref:DUF6929 family protein n=1 Tax=Flavobacterium sp. SUN046 TaxID=3002440 RepID=UPI002DB6C7D0|nr:hypothetical protein [Flavobacterium sp. SUN046]MEC4049402.1 hypothetical protein [Flavobacterium sp. SUN046]
MEKIQFSLLLKIIGLGSASGLIYHDNTIVGIGDNSTYLYEYHMDDHKLEKHPLAVISQEATPKEFKSDFEAITQYQDSIYIFGSGSTEKRNKMLKVDAKTKKVISTTDLSDLYFSLQSFGEIKPEDFNIEGAIYNGNTWYLFNRGNGKTNQNVLFTVDGKNLTNEYRVVVNNYKLPKIKGVRTSFTDAVLVEDKIYFLATAEDTASTYEDGEILGSVIGRIDLKTMKIDFTKQITDTHKLEGITLYHKSDEAIEFLLCEDNDTEVLESNIYKLKILGL